MGDKMKGPAGHGTACRALRDSFAWNERLRLGMQSGMKKQLFKLLVKLNRIILPSYYKNDPMKLTTFQKAVLGFRY